jgi:hypothetical protein
LIHENELWILSFYRRSEISGALFFGRLAQTVRAGAIQRDLTKHFSDESLHAWYWTDCIEKLGGKPIRLDHSYQDQYIEAAGLPGNIMEILAITQVFEKRVIGQYALHRALPGLPPEVESTLQRIMQDEKWHIQWVGDALVSLEAEYGKEHIAQTIERYAAADRKVYEKTLDEHSGRLEALIAQRRDRERPR